MKTEIERKITKVLLPHIILRMLKEKPTWGYEVIRAIRRKYRVYFGPSTVYPLLNGMEEDGLVRSRWDFTGNRPRKLYYATEEGRRMLTRQRPGIERQVRLVLV